MPLVAPTQIAQPAIPRECPEHPHTPFHAPLLWHLPTGIRAARAPPARPRARDPLQPSYPRHRASNFRSHTSTNPTRVHGGCDALPSVSRLSSSNHQTFAFPLSQKQARTKRLKGSLMESLSAPAADAAAADVSAPAATADADETALLKARVYALFEPKATDGSGEISRKELATKLRAGGQIESLLGIADGSTIPEVLHVMRILKKMETDQYGDTTISPQELQAMHSAVQRAAELVEAARRHIPQETRITYAERMHAWVQTINGASILLTALVAMVYTALSQREDGKCAVFPFLPENTTTTSYYLLARFVAVAGVIFLSVVTIWYDLTLEVADPILERLENPAPADQKGQWWSKYETRFRSLVGVVAFVSLMFAVHSFHLVLQQGAATCTLINALPFAGALVAMHYAHRLLVGGNEAAPEKRETLSKQYWAESRVVSASMYYARASGYVNLSDDEENATTRQCCGTRLRPANAPTPKTTNALACCGCSRARCSLIWFSVLLAVALTLGQQLALQTRSQPSVAVRQITRSRNAMPSCVASRSPPHGASFGTLLRATSAVLVQGYHAQFSPRWHRPQRATICSGWARHRVRQRLWPSSGGSWRQRSGPWQTCRRFSVAER